MTEKYGIFLENGDHHNYGTTVTVSIPKLFIGDFDSPEDATEYIINNRMILSLSHYQTNAKEKERNY